jgi:hypothetical protein
VIDANGLFVHVNDSIRGLATQAPPDETWHFICECPDIGCHEPVSLTLAEFDAHRSADPPSRLLSAAHLVQTAV